MRIEVICTGDEVLTGKIVNTNFSTITQQLEDCGLSVEWETTVGDDRDNLLRRGYIIAVLIVADHFLNMKGFFNNGQISQEGITTAHGYTYFTVN